MLVSPFDYEPFSGAKLEKHRDDEEWVVVIETCHQCECHRQEWLRHDPQDYRCEADTDESVDQLESQLEYDSQVRLSTQVTL